MISVNGLLQVGYGVATFFVGLIVAKRLQKLLEREYRKKMPRGMAANISRLSYYALIFVVLLLALDVAGFKIESLLVAGGIVGVAVGFASQKTVSNLISGLFLYLDRPFDIGDAVDIAGTTGVVLDITPLSTRVRTWEGPTVRIPNEKVFGSEIKNFRRVSARRFEYRVGVAYGTKLDRALEIINGVLDEEPYVLKNPGKDVFVSNLGDSAIEITVKAWTPASKNYAVKTRILKRIYEALTKAKIEIPFPQMDVHLKD